MLMMLAVFRGLGVEIAQLSPADAHDAGRVPGSWCRDSAADAHDAGRVAGLGQLMLMMLAASGSWCRDSAADAHDAGRGCGSWGRASPADAHDAGWVGSLVVEIAQLMLMMLAGLGVLGKSQPS